MKKRMYSIKTKLTMVTERSKRIFHDKRGEGFVGVAITILISVVIGALLLAGLYALFGDVVLPELQRRITEMFNYAG